ncbi:MAG TPA: DNA polymerase III subunit gamma/tau [Pyrinomonadaceae bacterium]|jgi:DNA polymerase-3 subunit gamma/tau|nr:DNA polymerase III subunit gamma/tau [Pyrinomonadaceae bacterium]
MAYQVIARKWRPQTFDEVTGQEPITRTLRNAIEHQRLHHAYLFSGARGVGKTTSARLLAKALNCHKASQPTPTPCRSDDPTQCASCREITESRSIDVQEIDAASNTGVDNVREAIIASVGIAPARDRYKVFIIDEVHMLSGAAFNALLKTLEEPPPRVVFIMATTERHKVPETILSRCQQFEFRTIATAKILERLKLIAKEEKISIPEDALREIARTGEGSMRDAQSALDQVISFAGDKIKREDVEMALGVAGADILKRIIDSIADNKPAEAIASIDDIVMRGHDLRNFCRDLLAHFRDLLVTKVSGNEELLESAICEPQELRRQAELFSESDLVRFFHSLAETETKLRAATQPRYQLEIGVVKLMELRGVESISEIIQRLATLESNLGDEPSTSRAPSGSSGSPSSKVNPPRTPVSSRPAGSSFTAAAASPALETPILETQIEEKPEVSTAPVAELSTIERVKQVLETQRKMLLVTALEGAQATAFEESELCIEFAPDARHFRDTLSKPENVKFIREACYQITGNEMAIRIVVKDPKAEGEPLSREEEERLEKQRLRQMAENSPVVQQMLKTFRGEIVDVRRTDGER